MVVEAMPGVVRPTGHLEQDEARLVVPFHVPRGQFLPMPLSYRYPGPARHSFFDRAPALEVPVRVTRTPGHRRQGRVLLPGL